MRRRLGRVSLPVAHTLPLFPVRSRSYPHYFPFPFRAHCSFCLVSSGSSQPSSTSNLLSGRAHRKKEVAAGMPLPQSPPPPLAPSFNAEPERHQDAGPVVLLTRADSERLPPAYLSWATNEPASGPSQPPQGQEQQTADAPRGESKRAKFRARNRLQ
jgi:hypothetical protein